jgi:hypothetical protein
MLSVSLAVLTALMHDWKRWSALYSTPDQSILAEARCSQRMRTDVSAARFVSISARHCAIVVGPAQLESMAARPAGGPIVNPRRKVPFTCFTAVVRAQ